MLLLWWVLVLAETFRSQIHPSCLVSIFQDDDGVMLWGIFSWHTLSPLLLTKLNAAAYLSTVADHVHPLTTALSPSSEGYFQQDNEPCHRPHYILNWFVECDTVFSCPHGPLGHSRFSSTMSGTSKTAILYDAIWHAMLYSYIFKSHSWSTFPKWILGHLCV